MLKKLMGSFFPCPPLMTFIMKGDLGSVKQILEERGDPNVQDRGGGTPLLIAIRYGRKSIDEKMNAFVDKPLPDVQSVSVLFLNNTLEERNSSDMINEDGTVCLTKSKRLEAVLKLLMKSNRR